MKMCSSVGRFRHPNRSVRFRERSKGCTMRQRLKVYCELSSLKSVFHITKVVLFLTGNITRVTYAKVLLVKTRSFS